MFKKTVIAAALAAVTGSAMADVSVSGRVEQGFADVDGNTVGWNGYSDNQINFKASEDLGNGMTAFAQWSIITDKADTDGPATLDNKVGLTGGFGTVVIGRMEDFTEGKVAATQSTMGTNAGELGNNAGRYSNAIAYVSPSMNGFSVGVAGYAIEAGLTGDSADNFDATDILLSYSNGPLTVMAAQETIELGANDQETTSFSVQYSMGDLSVAALRMSVDNQGGTAANDYDDDMFRVDYTMGANKITLQHAKDDSANNDINIIELSHNFSKRTAVYVGMNDQDTADSDTTYFGLQHTF